MRELLYVPALNPPEQVLHHAILCRDAISTLVPGDPETHLSDQTKLALEGRAALLAQQVSRALRSWPTGRRTNFRNRLIEATTLTCTGFEVRLMTLSSLCSEWA